jgi:hypothetical protein
MNNPLTLSKAPYEHPAMDYAFLRQEGIRHLERMAGALWTDFNVHDPGITILEQLCYAITDLANRIHYEVPDLLASSEQDAYANLYRPDQILTSHPVTLNDLRRLAIDVEGVKNVWIEPVERQEIPLYAENNELTLEKETQQAEPIYLKGLYRVLIEGADLLYHDAGDRLLNRLRGNVLRRLHAHRPLCADFEEITLLDPQDVKVNAHIEIGPVEEPEAILLQIYQRLANAISPAVPFHSLRQMIEAGEDVSEIFNGPLLARGFIKTGDLAMAQRQTALRTSDLIREIMDVPGVRAVRTITIAVDRRAQEWSLNLDPGLAPKLALDKSTLVLERRGLPASVDRVRVRAAYDRWLRQEAGMNNRSLVQDDLQPPQGRSRKVGNYYSFQHQFPANYGIGAFGLPESAPPQRKVQARQLKAYLLFYDQLLANLFSQVAHVGDLFSFSGSADQSYFPQAVDDRDLNLDEIRIQDVGAHQERLQQIAEDPDGREVTLSALHRRNRLLNHLLARFAEQLTDYSLLEDSLPQQVSAKQAFLQDYQALSSARGSAFNYLEAWGRQNRSGLEKRIAGKLGLREDEGETFYMVEHILLRPIEGDRQQPLHFLASSDLPDPYSLQVSFVFPGGLPRFRNRAFREFTERTLREELPAHLAIYQIHWLEQTEGQADRVGFQEFETVYRDWLDKKRAYWAEKVG